MDVKREGLDSRKKILSICIPTYNRSELLKELVGSILESDCQDFLIEITDNASTDNTVSMLKALNDDRIVIHENMENVGGNSNYIFSIFNCESKYALTFNDRDLIDATKIPQLISFLNNSELSFVTLENWSSVDEETLRTDVFARGAESIIHTQYGHHPTGHIFNADLIHEKLNKEDYINYSGHSKFSMLACDAVMFGDSAYYDLRIWNQRPLETLADYVSGYDGRQNGDETMAFFGWKMIELRCKNAMNFLVRKTRKNVSLSQSESDIVAKDILKFFVRQLADFRVIMSQDKECYHYNLNPRHVSLAEMLKIYKRFYVHIKHYINRQGYSESIRSYWDREYFRLMQYYFYQIIRLDIVHHAPVIFRIYHKMKYFNV